MPHSKANRLIAAGVFVYALVVYLLTVAPTASFWDAGEFIAISHGLEVSHPPGAPFYMLIGRFFSMVLTPLLSPFLGTSAVAVAVNLVSVFSSAFTVLLTYLIIVRLVREWKGHPSTWDVGDKVAAYGGGIIGALTFAVTDSFWFNAVESEVYAMSMLFTALVVWLILVWSEQAQVEQVAFGREGAHTLGLKSDRYLVLITYLFGLAIGVHLLNVLALFFVALIVFYTRFDRPGWDTAKRWGAIVVTGGVASAAFLVVYPGIIQGIPTLLGALGSPFFFLVLLIGLVTFAIYFTQQRRMQVANLLAISVAMVLIGYSSYALIFVRSAADPPIDENDPETVEAMVSYLNREQYGDTPLLKGATFNDRTQRYDPNNEVTFPRRHSYLPIHMQEYARYASDLDFFLRYQVGHMYWRYFLWNYLGRASDEQDAPAISGLSDKETQKILYEGPSEEASRNYYFGLPLLLGLIGLAFHIMRDWRRAFAVGLLFFLTGLGIVLYLNQTPYQPRERDYSYVASFFAFALWIGIGATGLIELARDVLREKQASAGAQKVAAFAVAGVLFAAVPLLMLTQNFDDHDRSGRYVAPDYAYNLLMSLDENAIVFTNGDNDTFPMWYLQEVEGVRQDVRVVNLSLLNTPWYIKQLKTQASRSSAAVNFSYTEDQIERLQPVQWDAREIALPVDRDALVKQSEVFGTEVDTSAIVSPMRWTLEGRPFSQDFNMLQVADQAVLDLLIQNARDGWTRPVYFAVTVSPDGQLNLENYFQLEGLAYRVVPVKHEEYGGRIVPEIQLERLKRFRFTNLDDPDVYFDENIRRMTDNYRNIYAITADQLIDQGMTTEAQALLDSLQQVLPFETIPATYPQSVFSLVSIYNRLGATDTVNTLLAKAEPSVLHQLAYPRTAREAQRAAEYAGLLRQYYLQNEAFDEAAAFSNGMAVALRDSSYRFSADELRRLYQEAMRERDAESD